MRILGKEYGTGIVLSGGAEQGEVSYDITVFSDGNFKNASGILEGDPIALMEALSVGRTELRLSNGSTIKIVLTNARGDGFGTFKVSGPVPGY